MRPVIDDIKNYVDRKKQQGAKVKNTSTFFL